MKYFVEIANKGAFHIEIEDARDLYILMEQLGEIDEGTARECYSEGREVSTKKSNARRVWGAEMSDRELMVRTLKGDIHKKTAMSVNIPKPKKEKKEE